MERGDNLKPLILLGSARKESDTRRQVERLFGPGEAKVLDLLDYKIYPYDYAANYPSDDTFLELVGHLLDHEVLMMATPVYWYSMSGYMKVFFDRLTDLVTINKKLGRQLKGKKMFMLAIGNSEMLPEGFEVPFRLTAEYLDMTYGGSYYCASDTPGIESQATAGNFKQRVMAIECSR